MSVFAAIDIGSNSVRLKVARVIRHRLKAIHEDRVVTRLGEAVFRDGALSPQAMDSTVKVLRRYHHVVRKYGADRVRIAATSALRDARNSETFIAWVHSATGWRVETISGLEEGRLIHLGVWANTHISASNVLLIDLGGGSCEITVSKRGHIHEIFSLPLGAVRLTQEFLRSDPPTRREIQRLRKDIAEEVGAVSARVAAAKTSSVIATSGTAAALAGAAHALETSTRGLVTRPAAWRLAEHLSKLDVKGRSKWPGIGPRRAEIVIAGAYVFAEFLERCKLPGFRYSPLGLRDGLLAQMLADHDRAARSHRQVEAEREDAVLAMCKRYRVDTATSENVRRLAVRLFRDLRPIHGLPTDYESYLSTAALLHDVGRFVNRSGRHRHTYYLISNSEIFGFTPEQRQIIAAIARYLGRSRPSPSDSPIASLSNTDKEIVPKAVVLLRLAKAMNHGNASNIIGATVTLNRKKASLQLTSRRNADLEIWMLQKERAYFREVFGRDLVVTHA
jgi:exopolyphosphatase / guanosine-5'-triphosphate,3'-diphosphate pyrophosphatase